MPLSDEEQKLMDQDEEIASRIKTVGPGRRVGTVNRYTTLKNAFIDAFYHEKMGGVEGLVNWGCLNDVNRTHFYKLVVALLPKDIKLTGDSSKPVATKVVIQVQDASITDEEDPSIIEGKAITENELSNETVKQLAQEIVPSTIRK